METLDDSGNLNNVWTKSLEPKDLSKENTLKVRC